MESFYSLLCCMGRKGASAVSGALDVVGMLPPEIGVMILRRLDGPSLSAASTVSDRWLALIQSDRVLSRRLARQLRAERRMRECRVLATGYQPQRPPQEQHRPLAERNGRFPNQGPATGGARLLAVPLGVHKAVKRKISSCVQSAKRRFAGDRHVQTPDEAAQPAMKSVRL